MTPAGNNPSPGIALNHQRYVRHPSWLWLGLLVSVGCGKPNGDSDTSSSAAGYSANDMYNGPPVSFDEALTEVLIPSCGFDSCHGSGAGYLRVHENQTESEWIEMKSTVLPSRHMVIPGDAANSYLIKKMENSTDIAGEGMPPPNGGISGRRIGMVRSWIDNIE